MRHIKLGLQAAACTCTLDTFCQTCSTDIGTQWTDDDLFSMTYASSCVKHKEFQDPFAGCNTCYNESDGFPAKGGRIEIEEDDIPENHIKCVTCSTLTPAEWIEDGQYWSLYFENECQNCFEEFEKSFVTSAQKDLIFDLFIIEGELSDETLLIWRDNPKVKGGLDGLTNDIIRHSARTTADEMNKAIGYRIY